MDTARSGAGLTLLQVRVGAFVLVALLVFVALVYFLGRQAGLFERQYRLIAGFSQIGGLIEGATVRLAGVPVGRVAAIRLPESGGARVQVELTLARRVQSRVRTDSVARIETLGLLGDKIVEITLGSPEAPVLADGAEVRTEEPLDTNQLTKQGTELLRNLVDVTRDLKTTIAKVTESGVGPDLAVTARTVRQLATEIERGQGLLHRLIYDRSLGTAVADVAGTLRQVGETVGRLDRLLADPKAGGLLSEASQAVREARAAVQRVNRILGEVEAGKGLLHALIYDESRIVRDLDALLSRVGTLVASVEGGQGALGLLVRDPATAGSVRRLAAAAEMLGQAVERARDADGLLKALVFEPEGKALVLDLRETARQFREITGRVARGESLLGSLTQPGSEDLARQAAQGLAGLGRLADDLAGDARFGEALADLRVAMTNLKTITARVEAGEGTIGGLIVDPTVYENLAAFLEGAQRSLLLRALIRAAIGRGPSEPKSR